MFWGFLCSHYNHDNGNACYETFIYGSIPQNLNKSVLREGHCSGEVDIHMYKL